MTYQWVLENPHGWILSCLAALALGHWVHSTAHPFDRFAQHLVYLCLNQAYLHLCSLAQAPHFLLISYFGLSNFIHLDAIHSEVTLPF